jgi:proteasome lid subunit RPN8/RPN11
MGIRHNEVPSAVRSLAISFSERPRSGLLSLFRPRAGQGADNRSLLLAHEAMVLTGSYNRCLEPLKAILERVPPGTETASYVLARAGIAAMEHGLPLDIRPIASTLDLDRGNRERFQRGKGPGPMVALLKELLRAMLLNDRSSWVESEGYARGLIKGSDRAFSTAMVKAAELAREDKDQGAYHELKCLLMMGRVLSTAGDYLGGRQRLENAADKAKDANFPLLEMRALQDIGSLSESVAEAAAALERAISLAGTIGNRAEAARSRILMDQIVCRESDLTSEGRDGISKRAEDMLDASEDIRYEDPHFAMEARSNAALWLGRIGRSESALIILRGVLKELGSVPDEDLEMKVLAIGVLVHMKAGDRKKAKRALLSLISRKPVKNHPEAFSILKEAVSDQDWLREDRDTKELFAEEPVYLIERSAAEEIIRRAKEAYPNEFGAMLRGIDRITHIEPVIEGAEGRSSFMFSMFNRFSQRMVEGEGVVHSHPSGAAYPSGADLAMFRTFPGINIIIGYPYAEDSMAAYDRLGNRVMMRIVPDSL